MPLPSLLLAYAHSQDTNTVFTLASEGTRGDGNTTTNIDLTLEDRLPWDTVGEWAPRLLVLTESFWTESFMFNIIIDVYFGSNSEPHWIVQRAGFGPQATIW